MTTVRQGARNRDLDRPSCPPTVWTSPAGAWARVPAAAAVAARVAGACAPRRWSVSPCSARALRRRAGRSARRRPRRAGCRSRRSGWHRRSPGNHATAAGTAAAKCHRAVEDRWTGCPRRRAGRRSRRLSPSRPRPARPYANRRGCSGADRASRSVRPHRHSRGPAPDARPRRTSPPVCRPTATSRGPCAARSSRRCAPSVRG